MSLLAQGKKKVKYGLDPQNTQWSNDTSKFGQRLMEKMGWTKGKGLGANESGMTDHIKASYKWDQRGLGATPESSDAWIAHQDDFNDILKMLNSGKEQEAPPVKDKATAFLDGQKRYYGRFSRGRVQKLRTTEDLDCIFGRRKTASEPTTPSNRSTAGSGESDAEEETQHDGERREKSHGLVTVTSSTSVQDYFASKMKELQNRRAKQAATLLENTGGENTVLANDKDQPSEHGVYGRVAFSYEDVEQKVKPEEPVRSSRGWYESWDGIKEVDKNDNSEVGGSEDQTKKKKKKKKKDKREKVEEVNEDTGTEVSSTNLTAFTETKDDESGEMGKPRKKKKKKVERDLERSESACVTEEEVGSKRSDNLGVRTEIVGKKDTSDETDDTKKLSKKKRKRKAEIENGDITEQNSCGSKLEGEFCEVEDGSISKKKKKKTEVTESIIEVGEEVNNDTKGKKKEKKRKLKKMECEVVDKLTLNKASAQLCEEAQDVSNGATNGPVEKKQTTGEKRKKAQKRKTKQKMSDLFPGSNLGDIEGYGEKVEVKKVHKKKKRRSKEVIVTKKLKNCDGGVGKELKLFSETQKALRRDVF